MAVSKFRIYDYWKDKAITKKFEIKPVSACTKEDDALSITEFPDEIFCWACQMPPYQQGTHRTLSGLWNGDTLLQRSHILEKSLNGEDKPENYFLLCPQCHAESPDTTDAKLFFAWVRYKRTHENYSMVLRRDMKKAAEILGVDQNLVEERFAALRLTRLDSGVLDPPAVVDVLPVLEQVMRMMSLVAQEKGAELTYRAEGTCTMLATRDEIHQIIYNLTDNAVKYTPPGSTVQVSLFREGDQVVLTVEDNGAGIPEEDLPRIFERFYRVDKARSRAAGGTGLGLAIVRDTVEKRGGTVEAANRPGGGAVFTVRWPWREGGGQT